MINRDDIANSCRYLTSKIIERVTATTVKTKKRQYILEGKLNVREAEKYETPRFIIDSFMVSKIRIKLTTWQRKCLNKLDDKPELQRVMEL